MLVNNQVTYGPLVETCRSFGIGRSTSFKLAASDAISTFRLGSKRYVYLDSLRSLPSRLNRQGIVTGEDK